MFAENLATFFSQKEHAIAAVYTPQGGGGSVNLSVIFEAGYSAPLSVVQSEGITVLYELAITPNVKDGDTFLINSKTYLARVVERDWGGGVGLVMVHLEEQ